MKIQDFNVDMFLARCTPETLNATQILLQLHDKGLVSSAAVMKYFGIDPEVRSTEYVTGPSDVVGPAALYKQGTQE